LQALLSVATEDDGIHRGAISSLWTI